MWQKFISQLPEIITDTKNMVFFIKVTLTLPCFAFIKIRITQEYGQAKYPPQNESKLGTNVNALR